MPMTRLDGATTTTAAVSAPVPEKARLLFPLPAPGLYKLTLITLKNDTMHLQDTRGVLLTLRQFRTSKPLRSPRLYFYVPKGLKKLAIYQPASLPEIMEIRGVQIVVENASIMDPGDQLAQFDRQMLPEF